MPLTPHAFRPNPKRLRERSDVTLCIAAACCETTRDKPRIVLCADHKVGTWAAQAEIGFKFSWVTRNWPALVAGDLARTEELTATFATALDGKTLNRYNVFDHMKAAGHAFREKLADELVRQKLSVSYEYLRQNRGKFPSATVYEIYTQISNIDSGAELIAAGFLNNRPALFVVEKDCSVSHRQHFAAIGTGAYIAEPALYQRRQSKTKSLSDTLYHVYEAKRLGEIAEAVGKMTSIAVISPPAKEGEAIDDKWVGESGFDFLGEKYRELGPKPVPDMDFLDEYFTTF